MLGQKPTADEPRDAVHVAMIPVKAPAELLPGEHVTSKGKKLPSHELVGVVDPFLREPLKKGEHFWLCLYPGTITAIRHDWSHEAFDSEAEIYLRDVAERMGLGYARLLDEIRYSDPDKFEYSMIGGEEARDVAYAEWKQIRRAFVEVTGKKPPAGEDDIPFSCTC